MFNRVSMQGVLIKDNTFKISEKGNPFFANTLAITEGKDKKITNYFNIVAFGSLAEELAEHYKKGSEITIEGKLENKSYEKDGVKVYSNRIVITKEVRKHEDQEAIGDLVDISDNDDDLPF